MTHLLHSLATLALVTTLVTPHPEPRPPVTIRRNPVLLWNAVASQAFAPTQGLDPLGQSRTFAILQAAIHDAINAIDARYLPYTPGLAAAPAASIDAAIAAASRSVMLALVPDQSALIEGAYASATAVIGEGSAKASGIATGQAAAAATLARRQADGFASATQPMYQPNRRPGVYQFTAPFDFANLPGWGRVAPFAIDLQDHRLARPLPLTSVKYARDFAEVKAIGAINSATRAADQSQIAQFWYEDSPLGWNRIASTVIEQQGQDAWQAARTLALVNFAIADGYIAGFADKYEHRFWRPVTAIQQAAEDGNPRTEADPRWQPFLLTPPVPDYPSTHTVVGAAAAAVLIEVFGDTVPFETTSLTLPGVTRSFTGFSAAARENGMSRIYAGIHFPQAVKEGYRQGKGIGRAAASVLTPVRGRS